MAKGLVWIKSGPQTISFTQSEYTNVTVPPGGKVLYIQTGAGANNRISYGLITNQSASEYSPAFEMNDGNVYYLAKCGTYTETQESEIATYSLKATTRQSYYYSNGVIQTTSSTSTNAQYNAAALQYVYAVSSNILGATYYKTITLAKTSFYSNNSYYYFSTTDSTTTHSASANKLTYKYLRYEAAAYNWFDPPEQKYWADNPTNIYSYDYANGYTVSGQSQSITNRYVTVTIKDTHIGCNNPGAPIGNLGTWRYGGGYSHSKSTSATWFSNKRTMSTVSYLNSVNNPSNSIYTKMTYTSSSSLYGTKSLHVTSTASKTYYSKKSSGSSTSIYQQGVTTSNDSAMTYYSMLHGTSAYATKTHGTYKASNNGSKWAKGDTYIPNTGVANHSYSNSFSRYSSSYGYKTVYTRSASAYVTTGRTYTSRASDYNSTVYYTDTITVTVTKTSQNN